VDTLNLLEGRQSLDLLGPAGRTDDIARAHAKRHGAALLLFEAEADRVRDRRDRDQEQDLGSGGEAAHSAEHLPPVEDQSEHQTDQQEDPADLLDHREELFRCLRG
jgi:hypothetical protein